MGLRTNPDRILENIDRQRIREEEAQAGQDRQAVGRELETEIPAVDATTPERMKRIFSIVVCSIGLVCRLFRFEPGRRFHQRFRFFVEIT